MYFACMTRLARIAQAGRLLIREFGDMIPIHRHDY
jgi:hypothetical protein